MQRKNFLTLKFKVKISFTAGSLSFIYFHQICVEFIYVTPQKHFSFHVNKNIQDIRVAVKSFSSRCDNSAVKICCINVIQKRLMRPRKSDAEKDQSFSILKNLLLSSSGETRRSTN